MLFQIAVLTLPSQTEVLNVKRENILASVKFEYYMISKNQFSNDPKVGSAYLP